MGSETQKSGILQELPDRPRRQSGPRLLFNEHELVVGFVRRLLTDHLGSVSRFDMSQSIGVTLDGELVAGVIYHDYRPQVGDIQLSVAASSPRWATRSIIRELLAYPFEQLSCRRITATVRGDNRRALRFDAGIGFVVEGRMRAYNTEGVDQVILGMMREEWREGPFGRTHG